MPHTQDAGAIYCRSPPTEDGIDNSSSYHGDAEERTQGGCLGKSGTCCVDWKSRRCYDVPFHTRCHRQLPRVIPATRPSLKCAVMLRIQTHTHSCELSVRGGKGPLPYSTLLRTFVILFPPVCGHACVRVCVCARMGAHMRVSFPLSVSSTNLRWDISAPHQNGKDELRGAIVLREHKM